MRPDSITSSMIFSIFVFFESERKCRAIVRLYSLQWSRS